MNTAAHIAALHWPTTMLPVTVRCYGAQIARRGWSFLMRWRRRNVTQAYQNAANLHPMRRHRYRHRLVRAGATLRRAAVAAGGVSVTSIPEAIRKQILTLDMHDLTSPEIEAITGVGRGTVSSIIIDTRGTHESAYRGKVTLIHDPLRIFEPGARFNGPDITSWIRFGAMAEGTMFEYLRRTGRRDRMMLRAGAMIAV